jgi:hypothetical protein
MTSAVRWQGVKEHSNDEEDQNASAAVTEFWGHLVTSLITKKCLYGFHALSRWI